MHVCVCEQENLMSLQTVKVAQQLLSPLLQLPPPCFAAPEDDASKLNSNIFRSVHNGRHYNLSQSFAIFSVRNNARNFSLRNAFGQVFWHI